MHEIILKQYPSANRRGRACYQALVKLSRSLDGVDAVRRIDRPVEVVIHRYPDPDIVAAMGLKTVTVDYRDGLVKQYIEAQYPFWVKGGIKQELGQTVCWRAGGSAWLSDHDWLKRGKHWGATPPYFKVPRAVPTARSLLAGLDEGGRADIDLIEHLRAIVDHNVRKSLAALRARLLSADAPANIQWHERESVESRRWSELATRGEIARIARVHPCPGP
jgi:hypothetical protein